MISRRWDFIEGLLDVLPHNPADEPDRATEKYIRKMLMKNAMDELSDQDERSIRCASNLLTSVVKYGNNVITPDDIERSIQSKLYDHEKGDSVTLRKEIPSWLIGMGMERVNATYCDRTYSNFEEVYVVPIAPFPEVLVEALGQPMTITEQSLHWVINRIWNDRNSRAETDWGDRSPEVTFQELDAFIAWEKQTFENRDWLRIEDRSREYLGWVNVEKLESLLSERHTLTTESEVDQLIARNTYRSMIEVPSQNIILMDGLLKSSKSRFRRKYGWKTVDTGDDIWWCANEDIQTTILQMHLRQHTHTLQQLKDSSSPDVPDDKLEKSIHFLRNNKRILLESTGLDRQDLTNRIGEMVTLREANNIFRSMENSNKDASVPTEFRSEAGPTEYGVLREFEEAIEADEENDEDEEEEEETHYL